MLYHMYLFSHLQTLGNNQNFIYTIGGNEFFIKPSQRRIWVCLLKFSILDVKDSHQCTPEIILIKRESKQVQKKKNLGLCDRVALKT